MLVDPDNGCHLTYCSNIHPGESWPELRAMLTGRVPRVRDELGWRGPFAIGLRVANAAARALTETGARTALRELLAEHELYVFTLNGFPYGPFHGTRVKEDVYLPDWRTPERVDYTVTLIELLRDILPAGQTGSISTVPGAYKARVTHPAHVDDMAARLLECAAHAVAVERASGVRITLALEPEPCCHLETVAESVAFFEAALLAPDALARFARRIGVAAGEAERLARRHLGLCLDLCHAAVEFESATTCLATLRAAGIDVYKMQVSAGLRLADVGPATRELLAPYNDAVYLHQVVARAPDGTLTRFTDLPEAFTSLDATAPGTEWRVHFHVPIFHDSLGDFDSTQPFIREVLAEHRRAPVSQHLEVETYTWDVLPAELRAMPVETGVARELAWTRALLEGRE